MSILDLFTPADRLFLGELDDAMKSRAWAGTDPPEIVESRRIRKHRLAQKPCPGCQERCDQCADDEALG